MRVWRFVEICELTFEALEGFKEIDERSRGQLLIVLRGNLHTHLHTHTHIVTLSLPTPSQAPPHLQVLPDVGLQHGPQTLYGVLY